MSDRVKLTGVGDDETLTSAVGIVIIRHVCSGIRQSVLTTSVDRVSERHVADHTGRSTRSHRNYSGRGDCLGECGGCRLSDCAHLGCCRDCRRSDF